jgi:hypothetical protein
MVLADSYPGRCPGLEFANAFGVHAFSTVDSPSMSMPLKGRAKFIAALRVEEQSDDGCA